MKPKLIYLIFFMAFGFFNPLFSQWEFVGNSYFYPHRAVPTNIIVDNSGAPYMAFSDDSSRLNVVKFNGTNWGNVGDLSSYKGTPSAFAIDKASQNLYLLFTDSAGYNRLTVLKFDGTSWTIVGAADFVRETAIGASIVVVNDMPAVVFQDSINHGVNSPGPVSVMKFNGSSWNYLGPHPISAPGYNSAGGSIAADLTGALYVAYSDTSTSITVKKFDGTNWALVGNPNFSPRGGGGIIIGSDNNPIVSFEDSISISVMKFNGSEWAYLGNRGTTFEYTNTCYMAGDANGNPYIVGTVFEGNFYECSVITYKASNWTFLAPQGEPHEFPTLASNAPGVRDPSIAIANDHVAYVGFGEYNLDTVGLSVMRYNLPATNIETSNNTLSPLNLYPNPTNGKMTINFAATANGEIELCVYDLLGKIIWKSTVEKSTGTYKTEIDLSDKSKGMYFLQAKTTGKVETVKFELQ